MKLTKKLNKKIETYFINKYHNTDIKNIGKVEINVETNLTVSFYIFFDKKEDCFQLETINQKDDDFNELKNIYNNHIEKNGYYETIEK